MVTALQTNNAQNAIQIGLQTSIVRGDTNKLGTQMWFWILGQVQPNIHTLCFCILKYLQNIPKSSKITSEAPPKWCIWDISSFLGLANQFSSLSVSPPQKWAKFESLYEYLDSNPSTLGMSSSCQSSTEFSKIFLCDGSDFENSVVSLMSAAQCTRDWKENVNAFIRRAPRHWRANKNVFPQLATNFDCQDYLLNFP